MPIRPYVEVASATADAAAGLAQRVGAWDHDLVEDDVRGELAAVSHLQIGSADSDARAVLQVDGEHRHTSPAATQHRNPVSDRAIGDPTLSAGHHEAVSGLVGHGLHRIHGQVRNCWRRLGGREGEDEVAADQTRDRLQFVRSERQGFGHQDALPVVYTRHAAAVVSDLLGRRAHPNNGYCKPRPVPGQTVSRRRPRQRVLERPSTESFRRFPPADRSQRHGA